MFIPTWALWVVFYLVVFAIGIRIMSTAGHYDFVTPMVGLAVIIGGVIFGLGYILGSL